MVFVYILLYAFTIGCEIAQRAQNQSSSINSSEQAPRVSIWNEETASISFELQTNPNCKKVSSYLYTIDDQNLSNKRAELIEKIYVLPPEEYDESLSMYCTGKIITKGKDGHENVYAACKRYPDEVDDLLPFGRPEGIPVSIEAFHDLVDHVTPNDIIGIGAYFKNDLKQVWHVGGPDADYYLKHLEEADSDTFEIVETTLARDKDNVWLDGVRLVGANPKAISLLDSRIAMDDSKVWWNSVELEGADLNSVQRVRNNETMLPTALVRDSQSVWHNFGKLDTADPNTIESIDRLYSKDRQRVYYKNRLIPGANPETFIVIDWDYSKDSSNVYYQDQVIIGADPLTFTGSCDPVYDPDYEPPLGYCANVVLPNVTKECRGEDANTTYSNGTAN